MPPLPNSERLECSQQTAQPPKTEGSLVDLSDRTKTHSVFNRPAPDTTHEIFRFLELPAEVRMLVYDFSFANTKLLIGFTYLPDEVLIACEGRRHDYHNILRTCKFIRAEAMPRLAHNATLSVQRNPYRRLEPQKLKMSTLWLSRIRKVEYDTSPNLMFRPADLPKLESIALESKIYHLDFAIDRKKDFVEAFVTRKVRKAKRLAGNGYYGLKEGDGIEVTFKTWLMNTKLRTAGSSGLEVIFDVRN